MKRRKHYESFLMIYCLVFFLIVGVWLAYHAVTDQLIIMSL